MTELENLLKKAILNEKKVLVELENERANYLNKLKSITSGYQIELENQSKKYLHTLQNQEIAWKQTLQGMQSILMEKLLKQTQITAQMQEEYVNYLQELMSNIQNLQNQLQEL